MPQTPPHWHVANPSALQIRHWPGHNEHVVFNVASGDLHLLNDGAAAVLERLIVEPSTADRLAEALNLADAAPIEEVLASLDRLGLIDPLLS